ncbi:MAG: S-adenosylmethionine:tRNA ribosyltransferase-isomerase [Thermoleophilaceae bacterium]
MSVLAFPELEPARAPAEERGRTRADVALLVATRSDGELRSARFEELGRFLLGGDLLVVNTSATLPAALGSRLHGDEILVHLSTPLDPRRWVAELRAADLRPLEPPAAGTRLELPGGGGLTLQGPHRGSDRLVEADIDVPGGVSALLARHGAPIRYRDHGRRWPLEAYQTVFALEPGSAEMPSAGRPFSAELVTELVARGVLVAPVTLHAGVSSLEGDEQPFPERYRVPAETARLVNAVHGWGGRVIAAGTTVVRALETVAAPGGTVAPGAGWTSVVVGPERGLRSVDGLITGWHEPESSHLLMLEAAAGPGLLERSYERAAALGLLSHEFGDAHLVLP